MDSGIDKMPIAAKAGSPGPSENDGHAGESHQKSRCAKVRGACALRFQKRRESCASVVFVEVKSAAEISKLLI